MSAEYERLPLSVDEEGVHYPPRASWGSRTLNKIPIVRRWPRLALFFTLLLSFALFLAAAWHFDALPSHDDAPEAPEAPQDQALPDFHHLREYEKNLPQHNLDLPYPEGREGR